MDDLIKSLEIVNKVESETTIGKHNLPTYISVKN